MFPVSRRSTGSLGAFCRFHPLTHGGTSWYNPPRMATATRPNVIRVRVSDEEKAFLEQVAREEDRRSSDVIRIALKQYYQRRIGVAS